VRVAPTVLVGLALPLAACGGSSADVETTADPGSSAAWIIDSVDQTFEAGTARIGLTFEYSRGEATFGIEAGERTSVEGAVDFEQDRLEAGRERGRLLVDGDTVYVLDPDQPDGRWRRYEANEKVGGGVIAEYLVGRIDPVRLLRFLSTVRFAPLGQESVAGRPATRYIGSGETNAFMRALFPSIPYDKRDRPYPPPDDVSFEVWVGEDGRVAKVVYRLPELDLWSGDLTTLELSDYGADVELEVPEEAVDG
jgi:hypothetical protein